MRGNSNSSIPILALFALLPLFALLSCSRGSGTPCAVSDDCWNSSEGKQAGRCFPKDVWCDMGECRARCSEICKVIQVDVNPCKDPSMICTEATNSADQVPFCTDRPISCTTVDDCPLFRPTTTDDAKWECIESICRYPGLSDPSE
jgi:hypothetical protein